MRRPVGSTPQRTSVLCPVDFSSGSRAALRTAATLARARGATLDIVYVNDPLLVAAAAAAWNRASLGAASEQELARFAARVLGPRTLQTVPARYHTALGRPAAEIQRVASRLGSDLIVTGSRGLSGPTRLLLGSTTATLLHRAPVPVLAVPATPSGAATASTGRRRAGGVRTVLAAIALGRQATADVRRAAEVARQYHASLVLLHVVPQPSLPAWLSVDLETHLARAVGRATRTLERLASEFVDVPVTVDVRIGHPADAIGQAASAHAASLIVMVRRAGGTLFGQPAGACTYEVLCHAAAPVLALPEREPRLRRQSRDGR